MSRNTAVLGQGGSGGFGGGALFITSKLMENLGEISCNGGKGQNGVSNGSGGGGGSGGSIYIKVAAFTNKGKIIAIGGEGGANTLYGAYGGLGGLGRIKIEYLDGEITLLQNRLVKCFKQLFE